MAQVIGQFQGKDITAGTDAEVAAQMAKIRAIPAEDIQAVSPVAVPPVVGSAGQAVLSEVPQEAAQTKATTEADRQEYLAQQQQKQTDKERAELLAKVSEATDIMRSVPEREEEAGLPAERLAAAEIASQIEARELRLRRDIEALEKVPGMTQPAMIASVNRLETEAARELADLSIVQNAKLRRIEALETSIDRRMKLELEPLMMELQFDQMFYQENREQLSKTQDRAFQLRINQEEREYQEQVKEADKLKELAIIVATNGGTSEQIMQISSSENIMEALSVDGISGLLKSKEQKLKEQLLGMQIKSEYDAIQAAKKAQTLGVLTDDQAKIADNLRKEYNSLEEVKNSKDLESNVVSLIIALNQKDGVADISAINQFQRIVVDPGVAVKEGDVRLLQSAVSFTDMAQLRAMGLVKGDKLTDEGRDQMMQLVLPVYEARKAIVENQTSPIKTRAAESGIDFNKYIGHELSDAWELEQRAIDATKDPDERILDSFNEDIQSSEYINEKFDHWLNQYYPQTKIE